MQMFEPFYPKSRPVIVTQISDNFCSDIGWAENSLGSQGKRRDDRKVCKLCRE